MPIKRRAFVAATTAVALAAPAVARAQQSVRLTVIAGHPPVFLWVKLIDELFIPEVDKRLAASGSKVRIEWTKAYGGTLAKLGTELEAIRDGIADLGIVSSVFQAPQLPLQNVTYVAPFGSGDIATVTSVVEKLQQTIPAMGAAWTRNKQAFLGSSALDDYHLFTTFPVASIDDLKGRKIMAPGPSANWINGTGAVAVAATLPEYYNNLKTGVAEGVLTFVTGAAPIKLWEVAGHLTRTSFGAQYGGGLTMAQAKLGALPPEAQQIFRDVGKEYSVAFGNAQTERAVSGLKTMEAAGLKVADLAPAERVRWARAIPNVAKKWAEDLESRKLPGKTVLKGYMDGLKAAGVQVPRDWSAE